LSSPIRNDENEGPGKRKNVPRYSGRNFDEFGLVFVAEGFDEFGVLLLVAIDSKKAQESVSTV